MAHWKDKLLTASFRGVVFYVDSTGGEIGRRVALHEYPLRDKPYPEDLGRKSRRIELEAFVLGAEYMAARDALIAALEEPGEGILVHPYRGEMRVVVLEARGPRESTAEGGMARFALTFVESGDRAYPDDSEDTSETVQEAADEAQEALAEEFADQFDVSGPAWLLDAALALVDQAIAALEGIMDMIPGIPAGLLDLVGELETLAATAEALIRAPMDLAMGLIGVVQRIRLLPDRIMRAISAYRTLFDVLGDTKDVPGKTANRLKQAKNQQALTELLQRAVLVETVRTAAIVEYASAQEAMTLRDALADRLDAVMEACSDTVYAAMVPLRTAMARDMAVRAVRLPRLITTQAPATMPALLLAYRLYGDATRAQDIVDRNRVRHPGFVPGGVDLEVLADA